MLIKKMLFDLKFYKRNNSTRLSFQQAWLNLKKIYKKDKPSFEQDINLNLQYDVMVVIPVYNSEKYLEKNLNSILNQKTEFKYNAVYVDDGSTDSSLEILKKYTNIPFIKVLTKKNGGVSSARNYALRNINAKYVLFVDSDDYLSFDYIQKLLSKAIQNQYDLLQGSYINVDEQGITSKINVGINGYPWGKLISSRVFQNLCFPENYIFEDTIINTILIPSVKNAICVNDAIYYYRDNQYGISNTNINKIESLDTIYMTYYCYIESFNRGFSISFETFCQQVRINWLRIQSFSESINESAFIIMCKLYDSYYKNMTNIDKNNKRLKNMNYVFKKKSFNSYILLMNYWYLFKD